MANYSVKNYFETAGPDNDNKLVLNGTVETGGGENIKDIVIQTTIDDISTASTAYVVSPVAGTIVKIQTIIDGAITGGDAVLTSKIGTTAITGGAITIANSGSAAGVVDSATPSAANVVAVGDNINIATDGGSTNTVKAVVNFVIRRS